MSPYDSDYLKFLHTNPLREGLTLISFDSDVNRIDFEIFDAAIPPSISSPIKITVMREKRTPLDIWVNSIALTRFFKKLGAEEKVIEAAISENTLGILHRDGLTSQLMHALKLPRDMEEVVKNTLTEVMARVYHLKDLCPLSPSSFLTLLGSPFTLQLTPSSVYLCYLEARVPFLTTDRDTLTPATVADASQFITTESRGPSTEGVHPRGPSSLAACGGAGAPTPEEVDSPMFLDSWLRFSSFEASISPPISSSSTSPVKMMGAKRPDPIHPQALELIRKWAPRLSDAELNDLQTFLIDHTKFGLYKAKENRIARTVEIAEEGRIIHLTRSRLCGDHILGSGRSKQIKSAVNLDTGKAYAVFKTRLRLDPESSPEEGDVVWDEIMNEISALDRFESGFNVLSYMSKHPSYYEISGLQQKAYVVRLEKMEGDLIGRFFEDDSVDLFIRPLIAPRSYYDALRAHGHETQLAFYIRYRKALFDQILQSMHYLHQTQKMSHGDIKPDNFLVDLNVDMKPEPSPKIALVDFGKHKLLKDFPIEVFPGTTTYSSPRLYQQYFKGIPFTEDEALHADGWACALTLTGLLFFSDLPRTHHLIQTWLGEADARKTMLQVHELKQEDLDPQPKPGTPPWLVWRLLQIDPSSPFRLKTQDITPALLDSLDWS